MDRRRFLAETSLVGGLALAGCVSRPEGQSTTTTQTASGQHPFQFQASVVAAEPTVSRPPVIDLAVTNTDDTTHVLTTPNDDFPFPTPQARADGSALVLDSTPPPRREDDCWRTIPTVLPAIAGHRFEPRETVSKEYAVLNHDSNTACWPNDSYEFSQEYALDPDDETTFDGDTSFTWGFTVVVTAESSIVVEE
ncbi:hypothetical protein [Halapricum salinum]|uniref:DUF8130 domain-containing protein n=1 Tax=Halapricum salinum TaxID=1457250 RepID=A0A4D6H8Z0_9EURY|nr:hypothetical protein [Halapricum salinum]QCC50105.1 hypothetical protein DV733_02185 [Halapricum salinum]